MTFSYDPQNSPAVDWSRFLDTGETLGRELVRIEGFDLDQSRLVWEAVVISLMSDGRAEPEDLEAGEERRGWWGAAVAPRIAVWGSKLWLIDRSAPGPVAATAARDYALEALAWMQTDGFAAEVDVEAVSVEDRLKLTIRLTRNAVRGDIAFDDFWRFLDAA